jgi:hypothetical protein
MVAYCNDHSWGHWPAIAARVIAALERERAVALWGCGYGLLQMLAADARLEPLLEGHAVTLIDNQQHGKSFAGRLIRDESAVRELAGALILTPAQAGSRATMRERAMSMGRSSASIVDPYE